MQHRLVNTHTLMAELNLTINFNKDIKHTELIQIISPAYQLEPGGQSLRLDIIFSNRIVRSENLLIIVSLVHRLRAKSIIVEIEVHGKNTYAGRIDFYRLIGVPFKENFGRNSINLYIHLSYAHSIFTYR